MLKVELVLPTKIGNIVVKILAAFNDEDVFLIGLTIFCFLVLLVLYIILEIDIPRLINQSCRLPLLNCDSVLYLVYTTLYIFDGMIYKHRI